MTHRPRGRRRPEFVIVAQCATPRRLPRARRLAACSHRLSRRLCFSSQLLRWRLAHVCWKPCVSRWRLRMCVPSRAPGQNSSSFWRAATPFPCIRPRLKGFTKWLSFSWESRGGSMTSMVAVCAMLCRRVVWPPTAADCSGDVGLRYRASCHHCSLSQLRLQCCVTDKITCFGLFSIVAVVRL